MTLPTLTEPLLAAIVASTVASTDSKAVLALQAAPIWTGPDAIRVGERNVHVHTAPSPLALRAVLRTPPPEGELQVVLTPIDDAAAGLDVCLRLIKGRIVRADVASSAKSVLRLAGVDRELASQRWLLDDIAALVIHDRVTLPLRNRILDADTAWALWFTHRLAAPAPPTTGDELLELVLTPKASDALRALSDDAARALERRVQALGLPTTVIIELVRRRKSDDLVPLGLVLDVVSEPSAGEQLLPLQQTARVRLESILGRNTVDRGHERAWAGAAVALMERAAAPTAQRWRTRAEELLDELDSLALATLSRSLRHGLDAATERLANDLRAQWLSEATNPGALLAAAERLAALRVHPEAAPAAPTINVLEAGLRLLQRRAMRATGDSGHDGADLPAIAHAYTTDLGWVDRCRAVLVDGGSGVAVTELASTILPIIDAERREIDLAHASAYTEWSAGPPLPRAGLVPIEAVLDDVVAPVAAQQPVLLIVLDGAGLAAMSRTLQRVRGSGWTLLGRGEPAELVTAATVLPSVTECSRASLLAGALATGTAADEKRTFAAHSGLRVAASRPAPVLFHKADLAGPDGAALSPTVREAILDPARRTVGAVVNAVDDHLGGGAQIVVGWEVADIRHLAQLLDHARDAGRVVIITADHGHVLDAGRSIARATNAADRGDRWRSGLDDAGDGELDVSGPRVLAGGGRIVVAVDDRIRYGGKKHGYHGGLTPQEVFVPVAVLTRATTPLGGWAPVASLEPAWWELGTLPAVDVAVVAAPEPPVLTPETPVAPKRPSKPKPPTAPLFDSDPEPVATAPRRDWISTLLATELFIEQRSAAARQPIDDARLRALIGAIAKHGFSLSRDALTLAVGGQPAKLRGEITTLRLLFNRDGYEALTLTGDQIALNVDLLAAQFGLDASTIRAPR